MTIGQKIQTLRHQRGRTQEELADALGVSRQAVSKWESDAALPDTDNVLALSRLFGVSTDLLLQPELTVPETPFPQAAEAPLSQGSDSLSDPEPKTPYAAETDAASAGTPEEQPKRQRRAR